MQGTMNLSVCPLLRIDGITMFEELVLGAMAELSDDNMAPSHVTYESVMQLSRQLRETHGRD